MAVKTFSATLKCFGSFVYLYNLATSILVSEPCEFNALFACSFTLLRKKKWIRVKICFVLFIDRIENFILHIFAYFPVKLLEIMEMRDFTNIFRVNAAFFSSYIYVYNVREKNDNNNNDRYRTNPH